MWIGHWNTDLDGWRGDMVIRRFSDFYNPDAEAPTKVGNYYSKGKRFDINGYFTDNGRN